MGLARCLSSVDHNGSGRKEAADALVDRVELLSRGVLLQQLAGNLSLRGEDNSILG